MYRHRYFDIWLHNDAELGRLLQNDLVDRVTLHEWPLSCVQQLTTADGGKLIYKAQFSPTTVESEFYARASSSLLVSAETIYQSGNHVCILFEFVEAPLLKDIDMSEQEVVKAGRTVIAKIGEIGGALPCFFDISTEDKWTRQMDTMLQNLGALVSQAKFNQVNQDLVRRLEQWVSCPLILDVIRAESGYVHGDLGGDNIFVLPDGYRVIDWQRPFWGPIELDLVTFLESLDCDPLPHVTEGVVWISYLLQIAWLTQCAGQWFPEGVKTYDRAIARLAGLIGTSAR